jgi:hypothetical protein
MGSQYMHWEKMIQENSHYGYHFYYTLAGLIVFVLTPSMALLTYFIYYPLRPISPFFYIAIAFILITLASIIHSFSIINPKFRSMFHRIKCLFFSIIAYTQPR